MQPTCYHELERVIDRFEEERRGMALRHEALMAENHELKQRLQQSSNKVTELNMNIEKLRETLQGQNGLLQQVGMCELFISLCKLMHVHATS